MAENSEKITKGFIYAFWRVILFVVAILFIALGFFTAMNSMNVNVITKDAFSVREQTALQPKNGDNTDLTKLFTKDFIAGDPVLNSKTYKNYTITSFYQRADVGLTVVWPWSNRAVVHATEIVLDIVGTQNESGEPNETAASQSPSAARTQAEDMDKNPPEWKSAEYDVTLVKDQSTSSWMVEEMKLTKQITPVINAPSQVAATPPVALASPTVTSQYSSSAQASAGASGTASAK